MAEITDEVRAIIEKKTIAHVATVMPDGSPQVTPVWVDCESGDVLINTAEGREKPHNLRNDPRVAISMTDPENPYESVLIRGEATEITENGADEHVDRLAKQYLDAEEYPYREPDEVRLIIRIRPDTITTVP